eukprot:gene1999-33422_t
MGAAIWAALGEATDSESESDEAPYTGAFAALAEMDGDPDGWETAIAKSSKAKAKPNTQPSTSNTSAKARPTPAIAPKTAFKPSKPALGQVNTKSYNPIAAARKPTHNAQGRPLTEDYYKSFMKVYKHFRTGEVVAKFHVTEVVLIKLNGDVVLDTNGYFTVTTLAAMNTVLSSIGIKLESSNPNTSLGKWTVTDTYGSEVYKDKMIVPARSPADRSRGDRVMQRWTSANPGLAPAPARQPVTPTRPGAVLSRPPAMVAPSYQAVYNKALGLKAGGAVGRGGAPQPQPANHAAYSPVYNAPIAPAPYGLGPASHPAGSGGHDDEDDDAICVVCMEHQRSIIFLPCGHLVVCGYCCASVVSNGCPVCREPVSEAIPLAPVS